MDRWEKCLDVPHDLGFYPYLTLQLLFNVFGIDLGGLGGVGDEGGLGLDFCHPPPPRLELKMSMSLVFN